jgi:voltage-gated potassium channel
MLIERWNAWDAFYMTVITVTTVGYREVHDLSRAGQAFTSLLAITGVGAALYTFSLLAASVVEGGLQRRLKARRLTKMIDQLTDHFILCGSGRIGSMIAAELRRQGVAFVVIERDPERVKEILDRGDLVVEADASREEVLKRVGIDRARGLIAAVGTDAENVYGAQRPRPARTCSSSAGRIPRTPSASCCARARRVVSPYQSAPPAQRERRSGRRSSISCSWR